MAWLGKHSNKKIFWAYLFLLPALLHLVIFRIVPVGSTFFISAGLTEGRFGFEAFSRLLTPHFGKVLFISFYYLVGSMVVVIPLSLFLALLLNKTIVGKNVLSVLYLAPFIVVMVAVGIIWRFGFKPSGFVNHLLGLLGISGPIWLSGSGVFAMPALIIATSWRFVGYYVIIFFSGLQAIPQYLYDAAKIDGANVFQLFRYITLPQLTPIILFVLVISAINLLRQFAIPNVMTEGGPFGQTTVIALEIYKRAFTYFQFDEAAAESIILALLAISLSGIQFYVVKRLSK